MAGVVRDLGPVLPYGPGDRPRLGDVRVHDPAAQGVQPRPRVVPGPAVAGRPRRLPRRAGAGGPEVLPRQRALPLGLPLRETRLVPRPYVLGPG